MINFLLSILVWLPMVIEQPVHMGGSQAQRLVNSGQATVVRMYEDGSAFIRWQGTLYGACVRPEWGCGD